MPQDDAFKDGAGARLGWRWTAVDSAGLYVPGGTASYPSSVLMNAIPAQVAGVSRIVMVTPASGGKINPLVLAAARRAGVRDIFRIGGAQAVAALAYGTKSIEAVDKIVGPGNAWVAAAKREVFGQVGIDSIAGPSEILVIADAANDPDWIAADLLSQAEHDASSQSILITDDAAFADRVADAAAARAGAFCRARKSPRKSWNDYGGIIVVKDWDEGAGAGRPFRPRASGDRHRRPQSVAGQGAPCRRDLPGPAHARSDGRLYRRSQPCAADVTVGAFLLGPFGAGFHEAHHHPVTGRRAPSPSWGPKPSRWPRPRDWKPMPAPSSPGSTGER